MSKLAFKPKTKALSFEYLPEDEVSECLFVLA